MGCSVRTLQRRLTLENTSYSDLIDRIRERAAMRMLEQEDMDISEMAQRLGYTEHSAFTRAFRRWTGAPPTQYRSSHKALR
jgi:AraC-like DNA-binding protein